MGFLSPITALLVAAVAVPALVALYFLKLRRREMLVPSTLLWKRAVQDLQVNAPFQKLRKNLLLLLQLLLLAALLLAMARPTIRAAAQPGERVAILIDHSASMNAEDGSPTRLDDAKEAALDLIDSLDAGGTGEAMVVAFADQARVAQTWTRDLTLLRAAVREVQPTDQVSRLGTALRLVEAAADEQMVVYVISDGKVQLPEGQATALRGAELRFVRVGESETSNVGIASFSARRDFDRPEIVQVFARLVNFANQPAQANVQLRVDGELARVEPVTLPVATQEGPGARSVEFEFVLPGTALVEVAHDVDDALAADDVARLTLAPARRTRVLLVGDGNAFLERAIRSVGVRQLVLMTGDKYEDQDPDRLRRGDWDSAATTAAAEAGFDVIIFDGYSPQRVPVVPSLYFGAAPPVEGLALHRPDEEDADEAQVVLDWERDHPLMRYVVLDDVILQGPGRVAVPADGRVLVTGQSGPIVAEVRARGVRHVVASFDVLQTNWPLYVSFPVFISNVVQTLGLGGLDEAGLNYRTGEVAVAPLRETSSAVAWTGPARLEGRISGGEALLPKFERVGVYRTGSDAVEPPYDQLPVNLLSESESDLRPAERLEVGATVAAGEAGSALIRREVWEWFVWGALALLVVEWLVYTRRVGMV